MTHFFKRALSVILAVCMIAGMLAEFGAVAFAADSVSVTIESFLRGEQTDLRSSELLVAKVEGYDGNVHDLTYEWKSTLGTYLYVYNSHNMYSINNTDGEIEIHNTDKGIKASENMPGRTYNRSFSGKGFAYAAVYGANLAADSALEGEITVTVKDAAGNVLATDSHVGKITVKNYLFYKNYTYSGIVKASLQDDLDNVSFGLFEGDTRNVKDLLGESAIVHIACEQCSVTQGKIESGSNYITLTKNGDYYITGKASGTATSGGDARVTVTVEKDNCKFHQRIDGTATTTVYVYKKPEPVPTTTSITLAKESLDSRCRYFIDGVEATTQADGTVIFTGLTPNTDYEIEVVGDTHDTAPAYAYVYTRTLPVFNANVQVYLNGTYDSKTATVTSGELIDLTELGASDNDLFIKKIGSNVFVELVHTDKGTYSVGVENGVYEVFYEADVNTLLPGQQLTIDGDSRTRYMFYNSVEYDANGGTGAPETAYYYSGNKATVSTTVPSKEGCLFKGWKDGDGNVYQANQVITESISKAYKLTAIWEDAVDVYVNVEINHFAKDGVSQNSDRAKHNITFNVGGRKGSVGNFTELGVKEILWDGVSTFNDAGYNAYVRRTDSTVYYAKKPTFVNMSSDMQYTFATTKSGYELESVETVVDENGDVHINAILMFDPRNFDLTFNAELDEESKKLPDELKPVAVNVKVTSWYDTPYDAEDTVGWYDITQHHDVYVRMALDENDEATATFPVWIETTDALRKYSYRINVVSYELADGTIIESSSIGNNNEEYITDDERYYARIDVTGGKNPDASSGNTLMGAHFDGEKQVGTITAIVSINVHNVTFDPNGGKFADGTTDSKTASKQIAVPSFDGYLPTRDGGYTFLGWYLADANGNMTNNTVLEGEAIYNDITLIAKWAEPLTVEGLVSIAGSYEFDGIERFILERDRAKVANVLLQKIDANGYEHTLKSYQANITYEDNIGTGEYKFENIPDDGSSYRIKVMNANYGELYQNESTSSQTVTNYNAYDASHYTAVFGDDTVATVNAYLPFAPKYFPLQYEVDATAVGESFRPASVDLLVLYNDDSGIVNPLEWPVISQLIAGDKIEAVNIAMTSGKGSGSFDVWASKTTGTDLYEYSVKVTGYNGPSKNYDNAPYLINYNGPARYSATQGQTHVLKATIVPKMYTIIYDLNAGEDAVYNMDSYYTMEGIHKDFYYWSYGKTITATPSRTGYKFLGWYDANGNQVTEITADMAVDITLTAKWEKLNIETFENSYAYIFGYSDTEMGAEGSLLRSEASVMLHRLVKQNGKLGDFVYDSSNPSFADIQGEWFQSGIEYMHHKGAFNVEEGGNVQPYIAITRGETFKIVALGLGITEDTTLSNSGYADLLHELGFIYGDENGDLNVGGMITRAEFCTMYNRIIGREYALLVDADGNEITAETYGFKDLDPDKWYYEAMLRATSAYDDNGCVDVAKRAIRNNLDDYGY